MIRPRAAPVKRTALWATAIVAIVGVTTISSDPSQARVIRNQNSNLTQVPQTARGYLVASILVISNTTISPCKTGERAG